MSDFNIPVKAKFNDFAVEWIKQNFIPTTKKWKNLYNSYGLKHKFENATGIYITNGEFKYAMSVAGIEPEKKEYPNWEYRLDRHSPGFDWVSHGVKHDKENYTNYKVEGWKPIDVEKVSETTSD